MRTEINKNRRRPSERWEEARGKGVKQGKNSWGVGDAVYAPPLPPKWVQWKLVFSRFITVKNAISLQKMQDISGR